MRKEYDFIILGGGPSALSIMDHYSKRNREARGLLIDIVGKEKGAYSKGVKVVNPVIPKLPSLALKNIKKYEEIFAMSSISEILLKEEYKSTSAYIGETSVGMRCCKNSDEYEILKSIPNLFNPGGVSISRATESMLEKIIGQPLKSQHLLPYTEHQWNVIGYNSLISDRILISDTMIAENVKYFGSDSRGVEISVTVNGEKKTIIGKKIISCLGIGNIEFERMVSRLRDTINSNINFKILPYYKRIYSLQTAVPRDLSSVIVPASGICITNESNTSQSIMYDTNAGFISTTEYGNDFVEEKLRTYREIVTSMFPSIPVPGFNDFICTMPVDPLSYQQNPENHFRFIISQSVDPAIKYFNLPYFTAIRMAINNLPPLNSI